MMALQSDRYAAEPEFRDAVDDVVSWSLDAVLRPQPVVEVCERMHDFHIVDGKTVFTFHAQIQGESAYWGCGRSPDDAVLQLTRTHPDKFKNGKPLVVWCGRLAR